jgi:hypothetical protein
LTISAQDRFVSHSLNIIFEKLPTDCQKNLLSKKECNCFLKGYSFKLKSEFDDNRMVHLGLYVFSDSTKEHGSTFDDLYKFIERELLQFIVDNEQARSTRQKEEKVYIYYSNIFQKKSLLNNPAFIQNVVKDLTGVTVDNDGINYKATLLNSDSERLELEFPNINSLILGMDKKELDDFIYSELSKSVKKSRSSLGQVSTDNLKKVGNLYISEGDYYLIKGFSSNTYYKKDEDSVGVVFQVDNLKESFSNLFLTDLSSKRQILFEIKLRSYGGNDQLVSTTVDQFLAHFSSDFKLYFGVEDLNPASLRGSLILFNQGLNFIHLLDIKSTSSSLFANTGKVTGILYPYIPCHNIKDLFGIIEAKDPVLFDLLNQDAHE